jgi:tetratricopeptide (TPR) repeat protein
MKPPPPEIHGYSIIGFLGIGGMGTVWKALGKDGKAVAIKLADGPGFNDLPERRGFFRREAVASLNLDHPALIRGLDVGDTGNGTPFIVMEFVEGETLNERVGRTGPLRVDEAARIGIELARGLEHAHGLGVLHRDIKPENVMLTKDGGVKLRDFGLVFEMKGEGGTLALGTAGYASPEIIRRQPAGPASDLYALGLTLDFAVLGEAPFPGNDAKRIVKLSLKAPPKFPAGLDDDVEFQGYRAVLERSTRKDAAERYASASELRLDLEAVRAGETPLGAQMKLNAARLASVRYRRRILLPALASLLILGVIVSAAFILGSGEDRVPSVPQAPEGERKGTQPKDDAPVLAVLRFLEQEPMAFERGRKQLRTVSRVGLNHRMLSRLDASEAALEKRFRMASANLLAEKKRAAMGARNQGNLDEMERILHQWPRAFKASEEVTQAKALAKAWREAALLPGLRMMERISDVLGDSATGDSASVEKRLAKLIEEASALLGVHSFPATQRLDLEAAMTGLGEGLRRAELARLEVEAREALAGVLSAPEKGGSARKRSGLEGFDVKRYGNTSVGILVREVLERSARTEAILEKEVAGLRGKPWAGLHKDSFFIGKLDSGRTKDFFSPGWSVWEENPVLDFRDIRRRVPDQDNLSSWLLCHWGPRYSSASGSGEGLIPRILALVESPPGLPALHAFWINLQFKLKLAGRETTDEVPGLPGGSAEPVLSAWVLMLRVNLNGGRGKSGLPARPSSNPALDRAREEFFMDRPLSAWPALEEAARADPLDAEIAVFQSRVIRQLAAPLPTLPGYLMALVESRRAFDLDPRLPATSLFFADLLIEIRETWGICRGDNWDAVLAEASEAAIRTGQENAKVLHFLGNKRLEENRINDALLLLQRATRAAPENSTIQLSMARALISAGMGRKAVKYLESAKRDLGPKFPAWAEERLNSSK